MKSYLRFIKEKNKYEELEPGCMYHVYNRANGNEKLFRDGGNYRFFLNKYKFYISPIVETYAFCLMPNHLHLLVKIKAKEELDKYFYDRNSRSASRALAELLTQQFSNFFNSYTKSYNKLYNRKGSLFIPRYKRKLVTTSDYLINLVHYIHYNPVEAGLSSNINTWPYSSYSIITSRDNSFVKSDEVIDWYEDLDNFRTVDADPGPTFDESIFETTL